MSLNLLLPEQGVAHLLNRWPDSPCVYDRRPTELDRTVTPQWLEDWIFITGCLPATEVAAIKAPNPSLNPRSFTGPHGRADTAKLRSLYEQGYTIRVGNLQRIMPFFTHLSRSIQAETGFSNYVHVFLTPGCEQGLRHHWDQQMAVIVQIAGEKRWELWKPVVDAPMREHLESFRVWRNEWLEEWQRKGPDKVIDLKQGQAMLLPRGWVHNPLNVRSEPSIHLTFAIRERTPVWIAEKLTASVINDAAFRRIILPADLHGEALTDTIEEARKMLITHLQSIDVGQMTPSLQRLIDTELEYTT